MFLHPAIYQDQLRKKRRESLLLPPLPPPPTRITDTLKGIAVMVQKIWSDDPAAQLEATIHFRDLLCIEVGIWIDEVIKVGVVPRIVAFLGRYDSHQLQLEAAWVLTNIASGKSQHTKFVIEHGAVPLLVHLLHHSNADVRTQAVWALGNLATESPTARDLILIHGALFSLLTLLNRHSNLSMLRHGAWAIANLCRGNPAPNFNEVKPALPILRELIQLNDEIVLSDACLALAYLSHGPIQNVQAVIDVGVCPRLVQLLLHPSHIVAITALRTVGNIVKGDDTQTQSVIDNGVLPCLHRLLIQDKTTKSMKIEACLTVSNITAGNRTQIQDVIDVNIIPLLIDLLQNAEFEVKKEAAWAIFNVTCGGSPEQIEFVVIEGCIKPLCDLLTYWDVMTVVVCLESLHNILAAGEADKKMGLNDGINIYAQMVVRSKGLIRIQNLVYHDNDEISQRALNIVDTFWNRDESKVADHNNFN